MRHDLTAIVNQYRKWNKRTAIVAMVIIFSLYIASASQAHESDNVGMIVVPLILLTVWGPAVSLICGFIEVAKIKRSSKGSHEGYFSVLMATQPQLFKVSGVIGLVLLILSVLGAGVMGLLLPLFPFWALKYLF